MRRKPVDPPQARSDPFWTHARSASFCNAMCRVGEYFPARLWELAAQHERNLQGRPPSPLAQELRWCNWLAFFIRIFGFGVRLLAEARLLSEKNFAEYILLSHGLALAFGHLVNLKRYREDCMLFRPKPSISSTNRFQSMAPALRMTRSIKEKLTVFLCFLEFEVLFAFLNIQIIVCNQAVRFAAPRPSIVPSFDLHPTYLFNNC